MKKIFNIVAIGLIVVGALFISYSGFTYSKQENVAQIGSLTITAETDKTIPFSPIAGSIFIVFGIGLLAYNMRKRP
jgi:hypothetical protein